MTQFVLNIPGWETGWVDWGSGGALFENLPGQYGSDTTQPGWGGGGEMYETFPVYVTQEDIAQIVYDVLDPYYGEGGMLEPVTVIVDPDRTITEEYIDPLADKYGETAETALIVGGLIALAVLVK